MQSTAYPSIPQPAGAGAGGLPTGVEAQMIPYRMTPPWGENPIYTEATPEVAPPAIPFDHKWEDDALHRWQNHAPGHVAVGLDWENDDQYGYPPPGAPNVQPRDGGHVSATPFDFSADWPWGIDPAFRAARYPHMENKFSRYNQYGAWRRNGALPAPKNFAPWVRWTQQDRDLMVASSRQAGPHQVQVQDAPSVPNTMNVQQTSPFYVPAPIGLEGVLPDTVLT